jgi:hypothetical protein
MAIIDFTKKNDFLSSVSQVRIADTNRVPDDFVWYDTKEHGGEIWLEDPHTKKKFKKKVYNRNLLCEFTIEKYQLDKLKEAYGGHDQLIIDLTNKMIRVRIKND